MKTDLLDYFIPEELIAQTPPKERGGSRLLDFSLSANSAKDRVFSDIVQILDDRYFLILNDTQVIPARIPSKKNTGGGREILFLSKVNEYEFIALVRAKIRAGETLLAGEAAIKVIAPADAPYGAWLLSSDLPIDTLISICGQVALPPYIRREAVEGDKVRYQTVYAHKNIFLDGSAAAPTAGLHFTDNILKALEERGVEAAHLTLQVGIGTFRPIKTESVEEHVIHSERYQINGEVAEKINLLMDKGKIPLCVGTTAVRAAESAAIKAGQSYRLKGGVGETNIFITPGYNFKIAQALLTNFHLPRSTLLLLVSAFTGLNTLKNLYSHAVKERYRFFSYGDAMLIRP
ncbi:MAG: tRNA preQ1(34) S-adenosylmethionine ribosyltransferase-isomerase QueA [Deferribacteraceae bacterium]|jgi:S-adenosylmethionine:tRNA ribosyltransferase-isomerase|nr:tRNA preQ1(34) S-adenosylmethionine ribosyltransferase-isomerase QueA [Deferribacteraceae bacterium]